MLINSSVLNNEVIVCIAVFHFYRFIIKEVKVIQWLVEPLMPTTNYAVNLTAFTGAGEGNFSVIFTILTGGNGK